MRPRAIRTALFVIAAASLAGLLLVRECAYGGGMGALYKTCHCIGIEWELYDARPADGPRKTICLGLVHSRTCFRYSDGPLTECPR